MKIRLLCVGAMFCLLAGMAAGAGEGDEDSGTKLTNSQEALLLHLTERYVPTENKNKHTDSPILWRLQKGDPEVIQDLVQIWPLLDGTGYEDVLGGGDAGQPLSSSSKALALAYLRPTFQKLGSDALSLETLTGLLDLANLDEAVSSKVMDHIIISDKAWPSLAKAAENRTDNASVFVQAITGKPEARQQINERLLAGDVAMARMVGAYDRTGIVTGETDAILEHKLSEGDFSAMNTYVALHRKKGLSQEVRAKINERIMQGDVGAMVIVGLYSVLSTEVILAADSGDWFAEVSMSLATDGSFILKEILPAARAGNPEAIRILCELGLLLAQMNFFGDLSDPEAVVGGILDGVFALAAAGYPQAIDALDQMAASGYPKVVQLKAEEAIKKADAALRAKEEAAWEEKVARDRKASMEATEQQFSEMSQDALNKAAEEQEAAIKAEIAAWEEAVARENASPREKLERALASGDIEALSGFIPLILKGDPDMLEVLNASDSWLARLLLRMLNGEATQAELAYLFSLNILVTYFDPVLMTTVTANLISPIYDENERITFHYIDRERVAWHIYLAVTDLTDDDVLPEADEWLRRLEEKPLSNPETAYLRQFGTWYDRSSTLLRGAWYNAVAYGRATSEGMVQFATMNTDQAFGQDYWDQVQKIGVETEIGVPTTDHLLKPTPVKGTFTDGDITNQGDFSFTIGAVTGTIFDASMSRELGAVDVDLKGGSGQFDFETRTFEVGGFKGKMGGYVDDGSKMYNGVIGNGEVRGNYDLIGKDDFVVNNPIEPNGSFVGGLQ